MREIKFRAMFNAVWWEIEARPNSYKQHGYVKRKVNQHPYADGRGYVMEHRLVMEQHLGEFLPKHAVIHHKNGVRDDNDLSNLEYMPEQAKHAKHHQKEARNPNGQFVASDPAFSDIKFRLLNKNTGLMQVMTLAKLIGTTFRNSQFEFRGRFTGLKDRNGKDIYEGDIINTAPWMPTEEYGSDYFEVVKYEIDNENGYSTTVGFRPFTNFEESPTASKCEVIGNIYENPELLNGNS